MSELRIFNNPEFGEIRTVEKDGNPLFCGSDVAKALKYTNPNKALNDHCREDGVTFCSVIDNMGRTQNAKFIDEGNLYRLITHSKLPAAEQFERWVFNEVLPSIRKHGTYLTPEKIEEVLCNPDTIIKLATTIKEEREKNRQLESQIATQKPLVSFANHVGSTKDLITMAQMAKLAHDEKIPVGRNRLYSWLREKEILRENREPYQRYIDQGYFKIREVARQTQYGSKVFPTTFVTGKGQIYLINKLRKEFAAAS